MALIVSAASGNFNAGATWVGGVVPGVGDEAQAANGHTITITANATCTLVSNTGTGIFTLNDGVTLNANVTNKSSTASRNCIQFTAANPAIATINGNCQGGNASGAVAVANTSTGALSIVGNCTGGTAGGTAHGANNASGGTINVTGICTGGSVAGSNHFGVNNALGGTVNITGSCVGGTTSGGLATGANNASSGTINITGNCTGANSGQTGQGAQNAGTGVLNVTGNVTAGSVASAFGANNASTGTLSVIGTIQSSQTASGVTGSNVLQQTILSGPFLTETVRGVAPVYCAAWRWNASPSNSTYMEVMTNDLLAKRSLYTADNITGMPAASNVKSGIAYGPSSELTGTFAQTVSPSSTDIATAVWGAASRTLTTSSGPTAVEIRQEIDANSTKLDASVSSRLASASYTAPTAPPTAAEIAAAVEGSLLNEADGQAVLNAIVGAIGNQNLSEVSLVAAIRSDIERAGGKLDSVPSAAANASAVWGTASKQITGGVVDTLTNSPSVPSAASIAAATRTELAVELARVDSAVSSRMAASEATKLDAVKVKTDALNTERLANVATTAIVGNLIAQSQS